MEKQYLPAWTALLPNRIDFANVSVAPQEISERLSHGKRNPVPAGFHRFKLNANFPHRSHCQLPPMPNKRLYRDESQL